MAEDGALTKLSRLKSPWILHYDCSSCNGCDIEILACLTPYYDIERFGILNKGNPKHADVLMVTGSVNHRNKVVLKNLYDQIPPPKVVIVVGACGSTGGVFHNCYNVLGGVDKVIPVDVYVPGCPPKPEAIIDGVVKALEKLKALQEGKWKPKKEDKAEKEKEEKNLSGDAESIPHDGGYRRVQPRGGTVGGGTPPDRKGAQAPSGDAEGSPHGGYRKGAEPPREEE